MSRRPVLMDGSPIGDAEVVPQDGSGKLMAFVAHKWQDVKWVETETAPAAREANGAAPDDAAEALDELEHQGDGARRSSFTAEELLMSDFPEPRFAVPNILAEGLNFLAGAPKLGKSWWAMGIAIAVASGGRALGQVPVERGEVLYLALEDSPRRLKSRLEKMLVGDPAPEGLYFETEWDRLSDGGGEGIETWVKDHPACRLIVVDVFARVRPRVSDRSDRYLADYEAAQPLKAVADRHGLAVVVLHHTRKAGADDFVEMVSGTHGLAAAADTIIVCKRARGQADATLHITGRDVEEQDLALRFDAAIGTWNLLGEAQEWAVSEQRRKIIEALEEGDAMKPKVLAEATGIDHGVVRHLVLSMVEAGQIDTDGSGSYLIHRSPYSPVHPSPQAVSERGERSERSGEEDDDPAVAAAEAMEPGEVADLLQSAWVLEVGKDYEIKRRRPGPASAELIRARVKSTDRPGAVQLLEEDGRNRYLRLEEIEGVTDIPSD